MSGTDAAKEWQALIQLLAERLDSLPEGHFYDARSDRYHPLRDQISQAFRCAHLADKDVSMLAFLPRLPEIEWLRAHIHTMPLDVLALHFGLWFSAERWGVSTVNSVFEWGILQIAMNRFADATTRLPFVIFDTTKIQQIALELQRPDPTDGEPDRSDGAL